MLARYSVIVKEKHVEKKQVSRQKRLCISVLIAFCDSQKRHYGTGKGMDKWNGEQLGVIKNYFYAKNDQSFWTLKRVRGKWGRVEVSETLNIMEKVSTKWLFAVSFQTKTSRPQVKLLRVGIRTNSRFVVLHIILNYEVVQKRESQILKVVRLGNMSKKCLASPFTNSWFPVVPKLLGCKSMYFLDSVFLLKNDSFSLHTLKLWKWTGKPIFQSLDSLNESLMRCK